jgi:hypothetical protein
MVLARVRPAARRWPRARAHTHLSYMTEKRSSATCSASLMPAAGGCLICPSASTASW